MGTIGRALAVAFVLLRVAAAQTSEDALRSKIAGVRYPPLAEQARIQGDVRVNVKSGIVTLELGHPLFAQIAIDNAKTLGSILRETDLAVTYHFVLDTPATSVPTSVTLKRGNALERAVLRMFGLKTEKVAVEYRCEAGVPLPNDLSVAGPVIEIWIHGREHCLETQNATVAARD